MKLMTRMIKCAVTICGSGDARGWGGGGAFQQPVSHRGDKEEEKWSVFLEGGRQKVRHQTEEGAHGQKKRNGEE